MAFGELQIVMDDAALRRAGVVGRDDQQRIGPGLHGVIRQRLALGEGLGARRDDDWHPAARHLDRDIAGLVAFLDRECGRLGRGAVDQNAV